MKLYFRQLLYVKNKLECLSQATRPDLCKKGLILPQVEPLYASPHAQISDSAANYFQGKQPSLVSRSVSEEEAKCFDYTGLPNDGLQIVPGDYPINYFTVVIYQVS